MALRGENASNKPLKEYLKPEKFDSIVDAVKEVAKFRANPKDQQYNVESPSTAKALGHSIKKCILVIRGQALRAKNSEMIKEIEYLEKLIDFTPF